MVQVEKKYRIGVLAIEPEKHPLGKILLQLAGIQNPDSLASNFSDSGSYQRIFLTYNDLLWRRTRSAAGLLCIFRSYFHVPVTLDLFQGQWRKPEKQELSLIGNNLGRYNLLGQNMIVGKKVWDQSAAAMITLGPLSWDLFQSFLPLNPKDEKSKWNLLKRIASAYVGYDVDLRIKLILDPIEARPLILNRKFCLGLNSWLKYSSSSKEKFTVFLK